MRPVRLMRLAKNAELMRLVRPTGRLGMATLDETGQIEKDESAGILSYFFFLNFSFFSIYI